MKQTKVKKHPPDMNTNEQNEQTQRKQWTCLGQIRCVFCVR